MGHAAVNHKRLMRAMALCLLAGAVVGVPYYYFTHTDSPEWVGVCSAPDPPLASNEVGGTLGRSDLRVFYFDCRKTWVVPGDAPPGWYLIPSSASSAEFTSRWLVGMTFDFAEQVPDPAYVVYRFADTHPEWPASTSTVRLLKQDAEDPYNGGVHARPPLQMDGPATFLNFDVDTLAVHASEAINVYTVWQVSETVTKTLPSIFVHLLDESGDLWATGDALDFSAIQWQTGDRFVQQHTLNLPSDIPPGIHYVTCGLYDLVTGIRYAATGREGGANSILLDAIEVHP